MVIAVKKILSLRKYFYLLPCCVFLGFIPFITVKVNNINQLKAKPLNLSSCLSSNNLEQVMNDYAGSSLIFDIEGNILTEGNLSLPSTFVENVTFKNYVVRKGDTISSICKKFGLSNISTIIAVNDIKNVRSIPAGMKLVIPSCDGLFHTVAKNESLSSISIKYNISVENLVDCNDLSSETISSGLKLFIPGARLNSDVLEKAMGELFIYPIKTGWRISSYFGHRKDPFSGVDSNHTGVDFACPKGTPIHVSKTGTVSYTGFSRIYGNYVIVKHSDGYQTLYAHMSKILATKGTKVTQGTTIGRVGSTGYSTGNHLHFTVYKDGKLVNPLSLLKK